MQVPDLMVKVPGSSMGAAKVSAWYIARLIRERGNGAGQVMTKGGEGGGSPRASAEWMDDSGTRSRRSECG